MPVINSVPPHLLADLLRESVAQGKRPFVVVTSDSMAPLLQASDMVGLELVAAGALCAGDIVTVQGTAALLTHRFLGLLERDGRSYLLTRGDRLLRTDPPWPAEALVGRASVRRRGKREVRLDRGRGRWANHRLAALSALEQRALRLPGPAPTPAQPPAPDLPPAPLYNTVSNGRPSLRLRLVRRLFWAGASLLAATLDV